MPTKSGDLTKREREIQIAEKLCKLANEKSALVRENMRLRNAIQQTLDENGHLADGDNCTLIVLKRAIEVPNVDVRGRPLLGDPS